MCGQYCKPEDLWLQSLSCRVDCAALDAKHSVSVGPDDECDQGMLGGAGPEPSKKKKIYMEDERKMKKIIIGLCRPETGWYQSWQIGWGQASRGADEDVKRCCHIQVAISH